MKIFNKWCNRIGIHTSNNLYCMFCGIVFLDLQVPPFRGKSELEEMYRKNEHRFVEHYNLEHGESNKVEIMIQRTPHEELFKIHEHLTTKALSLMRKKNADYGASNDPFANFRRSEAVCNVSAEKGIMVRLTDKLSRLSTFLDRGEFSVSDESLEDTVIDGINYFILLYAMRMEKKKNIEAENKNPVSTLGTVGGHGPL